MKREIDFKSDPVEKLILRLAIPSFLGIVVNLLYGFIDGVFIGRGVGIDALGGVTIIFPVTIIVVSFASLIGEGLGSVTARKIGEGQVRHTQDVISTGHLSATILSVIIILLSAINLNKLIMVLGATSEILPYAKAYYKALMPGLPFMSLSLVYFHQLNAQGKIALAMKAVIASTLVNILLDYLAIYIFNMGVAGAAYATVVSQVIWYGYMHYHAVKDPKIITIQSLVDLKINFSMLREICVHGVSSFIRQVSVGITLVIINSVAGNYGSSAHISAFGATQRTFRLMVAPISAISMSLKPVVGQNFGAKNFRRIRDGVRVSLKYSVLIGVVLLGTVLLSRKYLALSFGMDASQSEIFYKVLLLTICMFPLYGIHHIAVAYFTAIGKPKQSVRLNVLKQIVLLIPLVLILPRIFGVFGLFAALPTADCISIAYSYFLLKREMKSIEENHRQEKPSKTYV